MRTTAKLLSIAALAATTVFSSCSKTDDATTSKIAVTTWSGQLLGAQTNAAGSFFSPTTGVVYATSDSANFTANKVDISFAQIGATYTPTFIAPSARRSQGLTKVTGVNRATTFVASTLTKAQFDTTSGAYINAQTASGAATVTVAASAVYSFANAEGKKGLMYVSNLNAGTTTNGSVTIEVRYVK